MSNFGNPIGGVMARRDHLESALSWIEPRSGQTKDYKIDICYFSAKHATLRRKSKDW